MNQRAKSRGKQQGIPTKPDVYLRPPEPADCVEVIAMNRASRAFHRGWVSPPTTALQFEAYLARCQREDFEGLLVCRKSDGAIVGVVNLSQIFRGGFQNAYMGYYASAAHAGQGFMTRGVALALDHAFRVLGLHRVEANCQPENKASIALLRRLGFAREGFSRRYLKISGRWRDHVRFAMLTEDWKKRRRRN
ncbi:MAG: GNAT family N-acetyltransferase [Candidatus Sumerlaeaceae bacterium]|nr:GNAT family N-acetyltransferase [Candidatus Sumerlaeaceae bacterium]